MVRSVSHVIILEIQSAFLVFEQPIKAHPSFMIPDAMQLAGTVSVQVLILNLIEVFNVRDISTMYAYVNSYKVQQASRGTDG